MRTLTRLVAILVCLAVVSSVTNAQDRPSRRSPGGDKVFKERVSAHWFANNTQFWYRNALPGDAREFVLVNAEQGTRGPAFDHAKLAAALSKAEGKEYSADRLPFDEIEIAEDGKVIRFTVNGQPWRCDVGTASLVSGEAAGARSDVYECSKVESATVEPAKSDTTSSETPRRPRRGSRSRDTDRSPDGQWTAFIKDHNVFVRSGDDGPEIQLSQDGKDGAAYGGLSWAPDSKSLIAFRIEPGERKEVHLIQSSPPGGGRARLQSRPYPLPGDKFATYELSVFDISTRKHTKPDVDRFEHEWLSPQLHWSPDGSRCAYEQEDRGHQRFRVVEVDVRTGTMRNLIDERTSTFIWTMHTENLRLNPVTWLDQTEELIYATERSGWRHLYLIDVKAGKEKNAITTGDWVVRGIDLVDETNRVVWFHASGVYPDQDPYLLHYGRVNFDGTGLVFLTAGPGMHSISYSPDRRYLIDTYSRVDLAPVTELRRVADGRLVCALEQADITQLKADGWEAPEVFVAKGRDGKTDIWGIICRPREIDSNKKYPIIEDIYAGPQSAYVPKSFSTRAYYESLTRLGFIVVKIDGMGTAHRSKAFHDVCWHNLKDGGFPDRILWIKAAAAKYPYMDVTRVGAYGTSAGGQNAAGALLFHPEFYKAAVANSGCHDNRMDKASWNEQWMGYPVGPQYSESSNIDNAQRLRGHLFLIVGEMDDNVPPESTYRFVDALIKADKDFDLLLVPGGGHGSGGSYAARRREEFFMRHLLGVNPPNHNAQPAETVSSRGYRERVP